MDTTTSGAEKGAARRNAINVAVAPGVWMRRAEWTTPLGAAYAGLSAIFWMGMAVVTTVMFGGSGGPVLDMVAVELFFVAFAAISLWLAIRLPRAALRIGPEGVTLRGRLRTRELRLAEVDRFVPGVFSSGLARSSLGVRLKRRQGWDLIVWAMRSGAGSGKADLEAALAEWQPVCDQLNELLHTMRGEALPPSTGREPLTREEADHSYRFVRLYLVGSAVWFIGVATALFAFDLPGRVVFLAVFLVAFGVGAPLVLRHYRHELDKRVESEEPRD